MPLYAAGQGLGTRDSGFALGVGTWRLGVVRLRRRYFCCRDCETRCRRAWGMPVLTACFSPMARSTVCGMSEPQNLSQRAAIVTGSERGIGKEIALELARHGCRI